MRTRMMRNVELALLCSDPERRKRYLEELTPEELTEEMAQAEALRTVAGDKLAEMKAKADEADMVRKANGVPIVPTSA